LKNGLGYRENTVSNEIGDGDCGPNYAWVMGREGKTVVVGGSLKRRLEKQAQKIHGKASPGKSCWLVRGSEWEGASPVEDTKKNSIAFNVGRPRETILKK